MIERHVAPEVAAVFTEVARGRRDVYTDDAAFEDLLTAAKSALEKADPETVEIMRQFARGEVPGGAVLFHGLVVDEENLGDTPRGSFDSEGRDPVTEAALLGFAAAAGEVFSFARQHGGALIQNVAPVPGHEYDAVGTGSRSLLDWHTEDAFDDAHAEYIGLFCLRGDPSAKTALAPMDLIEVGESDAAILRQPRYMHGIDKASGGNGRPEDGVRGVVIAGDAEDPWVRIDMDCAAAVAGDDEAAAALERFHAAADKAGLYVTLAPGDLLIWDNHRVLHARSPFTPRYDGTDRWLQRVSITSDLTPSRGRLSNHPRVVENEQLTAGV